jgi:hypothetical protein
MNQATPVEISAEIWDAVAEVASIEAVIEANGRPSAITTLIEESVKAAFARDAQLRGEE